MKESLSRLITNDKSTLVSAINEARMTGQGHNLIKNSEDYIFQAVPEGVNVSSKGQVIFNAEEESWTSVSVEPISFKANDKMVLSIELYNDSDVDAEVSCYFNYRDKNFGSTGLGVGNAPKDWVILKPKTWTFFSTASTTVNPSIVAIVQAIGIKSKTFPATIKYRNIKLEYGSTPTAYTKSLDDYLLINNKEEVKAPKIVLGEQGEIVFNSEKKAIEFLLA